MSRRRRTAVFTLCLLVAALLVLLDRSPLGQKWRPQSGDFEKYHAKNFTVARVVDGDTLDIDIPDGKQQHTRIRLLGVDAPETKGGKYQATYFGPEATEFAATLASAKQVTVFLDRANHTRGKYGRLLAYVKLPDDRPLNEALLTEGYAYADLRFGHGLYNRYRQLEAVARRQRKGLWAKVTRDQLPEWLRRKKPTLLLDK
ncbi:MAG: thermonuclease family protein [Planctomycetota bacterium]